jgi:small subunit ribosomal protein S9
MPTTKSATATTVTTSTTKQPSIHEYFYGLGRRKTAVAKVRLYKNGSGLFKVNNRELKDYFPVDRMMDTIFSPFRLTSTIKKFDISAKVDGGGVHAQADALRHGIARALLSFDIELRGALKKAGLLTRDARKKERKKPGLKKARRAPQFSKR